jgi:hypothetical protein
MYCPDPCSDRTTPLSFCSRGATPTRNNRRKPARWSPLVAPPAPQNRSRARGLQPVAGPVANRTCAAAKRPSWSEEFASAPAWSSTRCGMSRTDGEQSPRKVHGSTCAFRASFRIELPRWPEEAGPEALISWAFLVLPVRIELTTSPLPRECSTTELRQRAPARTSKISGVRRMAAMLATGAKTAQARPPHASRLRCSCAAGLAFCRSASLSSTFLIRSGAKSCCASAMPRSNDSA